MDFYKEVEIMDYVITITTFWNKPCILIRHKDCDNSFAFIWITDNNQLRIKRFTHSGEGPTIDADFSNPKALNILLYKNFFNIKRKLLEDNIQALTIKEKPFDEIFKYLQNCKNKTEKGG
jgi:hypothetical protein